MLKPNPSVLNSLGMRFVQIDPGSFVMGADVRPLSHGIAVAKHRFNGDYDEHPRHRVNISAPFLMGVTQVTNSQYEAFDPQHRDLRGRLGFSNDDDDAVIFVSWEEASAFCHWLSKREGRPYRLPTEAEWEYACRAGGVDPYATGDQLPAALLKNPRESWFPNHDRDGQDEPVSLLTGNTPSNAWGLCDMHGNVEEWCHDWYGPYVAEQQTDPVGYADGDFKVTRGGSHSTEPYYLRSANRLGALPEERSWLIGFRVVLGDLPETTSLVPSRSRVQMQDRVPEVTGAPPTQSTSTPFFAEPKPFVNIPPGSYGPLYSEHNHLPAVVECPNGDLLAIWFTCMRERGRELALASSRLRCGGSEWDRATPFWDAPDRNMTGAVLMRDGDRILQFGALAVAATWGSMAIYRRISEDAGKTWTKAEWIVPDHANGQVLPINLPFRSREGEIVLPCDDGAVAGTRLYFGDLNGGTWRASESSARGIHAAVAQLLDGRLLAFGRLGEGTSARMPMSMSADAGRSWDSADGPFDTVHSGQRPVMMRLRQGPLFFASFARGMQVTDASDAQRAIWGLFGALSYDEGKTWPVRRLISDDGPGRWMQGGAWTGGFLMSHTYAEPRGYLTATQDAAGMMHLLSSRNHYAFTLAWLEKGPPGVEGDGLL